MYDDCLYVVYHLPLLGGNDGYRVRSSPALKSPGGKHIVDEEIERNERHEYREVTQRRCMGFQWWCQARVGKCFRGWELRQSSVACIAIEFAVEMPALSKRASNASIPAEGLPSDIA